MSIASAPAERFQVFQVTPAPVIHVIDHVTGLLSFLNKCVRVYTLTILSVSTAQLFRVYDDSRADVFLLPYLYLEILIRKYKYKYKIYLCSHGVPNPHNDDAGGNSGTTTTCFVFVSVPWIAHELGYSHMLHYVRSTR